MLVDVASIAQRISENIQKVILGKKDEIELAILALLSKGHILLEDVPGVGKTVLAKSLAASLGCSFKRIQFTPDLLPSDVIGVSIYNQKLESLNIDQVQSSLKLCSQMKSTELLPKHNQPYWKRWKRSRLLLMG